MAEINALPPEDQGNYATRSYLGRKAARRVLEEQQASAQEASERNLDEIKEEIEKKAEEAFNKSGQASQDKSVKPEDETQTHENSQENHEEGFENETRDDLSAGAGASSEKTYTPEESLTATNHSPLDTVAPAEAVVSNPTSSPSSPSV